MIRAITTFAVLLPCTLVLLNLLCPFTNVISPDLPTETVSLKQLYSLGHPFDLQRLQKLGEGRIIGPESIVVASGKYFAGTADGKIISFNNHTKEIDVISVLGGRPLGIHILETGELIVAEAVKGGFLWIFPFRFAF